MKITRDVICDLLPGYFADDVSDDTRALVDEFFASDPQFQRMSERFRRLGEESREATAESKEARERAQFDRTRTLLKRRQEGRAFAIGYGLAALWALGIAFLTASGVPSFRHPGVIIAIVFGCVSLASWLFSHQGSHGSWTTNS